MSEKWLRQPWQGERVAWRKARRMKATVSSDGGFLFEKLVSSMREATAPHCGLALEM